MLYILIFRAANDNTYRIVHKAKYETMWNEVLRDHPPDCPGTIECDEVNRGLAWIQTARCTLCTYKSKPHKLFNEVRLAKRGPGTAEPNAAVQLAQSSMPIGNEGIRKLCLVNKIPAPSAMHINAENRGESAEKNH